MFYSCSGFSVIPQETKVKFGEKETPLWQDMIDWYNVASFHVVSGGGDQLYQDKLIKEEIMELWVDGKDIKKRLAMALSTEMCEGLEHFSSGLTCNVSSMYDDTWLCQADGGGKNICYYTTSEYVG
ncbi:hypothetical protein BJV82DRAFT_702952 [Fennellomyces sp. T-0311]|nr:hypothetical protein BJV82DRAFT_702952 [Fennellomyces sp. T-0311]